MTSEVPAESSRWRRRGTLRVKLARAIVALLALMGGVVLAVVALVQTTVSAQHLAALEVQIRQTLMTKGMGITQSHAALFRSLVADTALTEMHNTIAREVTSDEDVIYGVFISRQGQPWAYSSPASPPRLIEAGKEFPNADAETVERDLKLPRSAFQVDAPTTRTAVLFGQHVVEFAVPVRDEGELLGTLRFGATTARMRQSLDQARERDRELSNRALATVGLVVLLTLVLGVLGALRAARRIANPVDELTRAAQKLAARQERTLVNIRSNDELEVLGDTFNRMALDLKTSYVAVEEKNLDLAREVQERRRAETERSELQSHLVQSQKMEAFGQLAGGVAHDFNNILSVVLGNTSIILDEVSEQGCSEEVHELVTEILEAAERGSNLTRQLLTFARRETDNPRIVALREVVESFQKLIRRMLEENVELTVECAPESPRIQADPGRLEQVLMNLCVNARDAMPTGGSLMVTTSRVQLAEARRCVTGIAPAGEYAEVRVADTGMGMPPEVIQRVFEPFFTTKPAGYGTGLGLATVHGIVQGAGGYIDVESELGRGTTFRILLPALDGTAGKDEGRRRGRRPQGGDARILLCEDEAAVRMMTARMLARNGYLVATAETPEQALAELDNGPFDLLLTDVVMPGINGRELAERVRARAPETKVLFMSGYTAGILKSQGLENLQGQIIRKPFATDELLERLHEVLRGQSAT